MKVQPVFAEEQEARVTPAEEQEARVTTAQEAGFRHL